MHQSSRYGYLLINGQKPSNRVLNKLLRLHHKTLQAKLKELLIYGVVKEDENGVFYCERMIKDELALRFRPELLNRLDRVVVFQPLNRGPIKELLKRELKKILSRVESVQLVACQAGDDVLEWLLSQPLPKEEGARAVRRLVEKEITAAIGRILTEQPQKKKLRIKATSNGLKLS